MDAAAHYRHLLALGREDFLAAAAPAVFVRYRGPTAEPRGTASQTETIAPGAVDETMPHGKFTPEPVEMELYPLAKKPGASFPDRITIGRTSNNDVVIADPSVSRLHAYVRQAAGWIIADAGSKNGSWLDGLVLEPRRETPLRPGAELRLGDVLLTFHRSEDLFDLMAESGASGAPGGDRGDR